MPGYRAVLERLDAFHNVERSEPAAGALSGGTERMRKLMERLGSPQAAIPAVHVAGTKGKGSVTHLVAAALTAAGLKTGLYTSPHVSDVRERIMIQGRPVSEKRFVDAATEALRAADELRAEGVSPSWFEVFTAVAFVAFRNASVDAMVLETGLGGRLDATNLPDLRLVASGLTTISRDHEDILGEGLRAIAGEKAAIIREHVPVVIMPQEEGVMQLILDRARELHAPVFVVGRDVQYEIRKPVQPDKPGLGQRLNMETWRNVYPDVPLAMIGAHQVVNAALALGLTELFLEYMDSEPLDSLVLKRAWRSLGLPARMEVVSGEPWHVIDGAHNAASAWAAAETVVETFSSKKRALIFGVAADKDYRTMLRVLVPLFGRVVLVGFDSPRAMEPAGMLPFVEKEFPGVKASVAVDLSQALELAESYVGNDGVVLTTGSLYLAGEMREVSRPEVAKA